MKSVRVASLRGTVLAARPKIKFGTDEQMTGPSGPLVEVSVLLQETSPEAVAKITVPEAAVAQVSAYTPAMFEAVTIGAYAARDGSAALYFRAESLKAAGK